MNCTSGTVLQLCKVKVDLQFNTMSSWIISHEMSFQLCYHLLAVSVILSSLQGGILHLLFITQSDKEGNVRVGWGERGDLYQYHYIYDNNRY